MKGLLVGIIALGLTGFGARELIRYNQEQRGEKYYYYPALNLYYDVDREQYLYSVDGARTWNILPARSDRAPGTLGNRVVLYSPEREVWKQNEAHRRQYNGILTEIKVPEPRPPAPPAEKSPAAEDEKPRKGNSWIDRQVDRIEKRLRHWQEQAEEKVEEQLEQL